MQSRPLLGDTCIDAKRRASVHPDITLNKSLSKEKRHSLGTRGVCMGGGAVPGDLVLGGKHSAFMSGAGLSSGGGTVSFRRNIGNAAAAAASSPHSCSASRLQTAAQRWSAAVLVLTVCQSVNT